MYAHEFAYWLQGYFELRNESRGLSASQVMCIKNHLALVEKVDKDLGKVKTFCVWLKGVIEALDIGFEGSTVTITQMIQKGLAEVFEHEIDKKYGDDQDGLNQVHGGGSATVFRC